MDRNGYENNQQSVHQEDPDTELHEMKKISFSLTAYSTNPLYKFSSYAKLCHVIAYCRRYLSILLKQKKQGPLMLDELEKAEITIIR